MAKAYPVELRERVVAAVVAADLSWREAARRYDVGQAALARWLARWRAGQSLQARREARPGPAPCLDAAARTRLQAPLAAAPDSELGG